MTMRWMSLAAALILGPLLLASAQDTPTAAPNGVAHIALRVSDLNAEVSFFGKLGFDQAFADKEKDGRMIEILIKVNDETFIQLYPQADPKQPLGFMHVSYEAQDLKALNARYTAVGLKPNAVQQDGAGDLWFNLPDPDGRPTEFTEYLSSSRQVADVGQHLGNDRVSDELLGFELPVKDVEASQKFYEKLGFDAAAEGWTVRLSLAGNPDLRVVLHPWRANSQPQFLFPVDDAARTANELQRAGVQAELSGKLVLVHDGDGNAFVLLETGGHSPRHQPTGKK